MRLEIIVPDTASPELKARLVTITQRLTESPELAEDIVLDEDEAIQRMFTPELLAEIEETEKEMDAGVYFTTAQVDDLLDKERAAWIEANGLN